MRLLSWITALNALVASGFSIVGLASPKSILPPDTVITEASHIFALYSAARAIPLALLTLVIIYKKLNRDLVVLGILAGIIQFMDAGVGLYQPGLGKSLGPLFIAALQFYAVISYLRSSERQKMPA